MQDKEIVYVSPSSVYRVLKYNDLIPYQDYHQKKDADCGIEVENPKQMWHINIIYMPIGNQNAYMISGLDNYFRYIIHRKLSFAIRT